MSETELRGMDAEVHRVVFGGRVEYDPTVTAAHEPLGHDFEPIPRYSSDMNAAMDVFHEVNGRSGSEPWMSENTDILTGEKEWHVVLDRREGVGPTAPIAICRAALAAVKGE